MNRKIHPKNAAAGALVDPRYRKRVVKAKKGKGAYSRKIKHRGR